MGEVNFGIYSWMFCSLLRRISRTAVCIVLSGIFVYTNAYTSTAEEDPRSSFIKDVEGMKKTPYTRQDFQDFITKCDAKGIAPNFSKEFGNNFYGADFSELDMRGSIFEDVNLMQASFRHSNISNTVFTNSDMRGTDFSNTDLNKSRFENVDLKFANLALADLSGVK
ncbi:pentapeptide repeat-containing protein, partial [Anaplasma phagocytophilum]|uniref:pentapeptide repeat-containing protein n=1 Tax=Anaplasma phagocytophilum TaxID=948 RepID=UPI00210ABDE1